MAAFSLGLVHGSAKHEEGQVVHCSEVVPLIAFGTLGWEQALAHNWLTDGVAMLSWPVPAPTFRQLGRQLCAEHRKFGGRTPSSHAYGLRSAGGWPHSAFAQQMREMPQWHAAWHIIQSCDGRLPSPLHLPLRATAQAVAVTHVDDGYVGLQGHKDVLLVEGAPELFLNQSCALLCPPPCGFLRAGAFSSFLPLHRGRRGPRDQGAHLARRRGRVWVDPTRPQGAPSAGLHSGRREGPHAGGGVAHDAP